MDLDVAAIAQTMPVGTLDFNQVLPGASSIMHVAPVGVQTISHVIWTEIHPHRFVVAVHVPVRLPRVLDAGVDAAVLVAGVGIDSQPLARFVIIIIILVGVVILIFIRGIHRCSRVFHCHCFLRQFLPLPLLLLQQLLLMPQPIEVVQIRLAIPKELSKGIVVPSVFHQVLDGPHAPYFGVDGGVLELEP